MSVRLMTCGVVWPLAAGVIVMGLSGCGNKQREAKSELTAKSFTFTVDEYMRAAKEGDVGVLEHFLAAGMEVDVTDGEGTTALFRAAQAGRAEAVKLLAGRGANLEVTGTGFDTPLVAAARSGTLETVKVLLSAKADPLVRTKRNSWTALTAAAFRGDVAIVNELAPVSAGSLDEALQIASLKGVPEVVDALLRHGADVFSRSKDDKTPLMYAAEYGHVDAVRLLLLAGSNKLLIDNNKQTAADLALAKGHSHVLPVLNDPKLVPAALPEEAAGAAMVAATSSEAGQSEAGGVPAEVPTHPEAVADGLGGVSADGPAVSDPELSAEVASSAPFVSPTGEDGHLPVSGRGAAAGAGVAAEPTEVVYPRLQGAKLVGLADGSTEKLKEVVRVREFREGQLPIVLEEVPAVGESARIRVLSKAGGAPEIVPAGGAIGDTGLELVRVERRFMNSKMGEGRELDVSHVVVRDRTTGQRHVVRRNQAASASEPTALISTGVEGGLYEVQEGDEFTAGENQESRYKVLDVRPTQVVVENLDTRETATLARTYAQ